MSTAEIVSYSGGQAVMLPVEFQFNTSTVSIRRDGSAVILEPVKAEALKSRSWPEGFFDSIRIDDPAFARPDQGRTPSAPELG